MKLLREYGIYVIALVLLTGFVYFFNLHNKLFWDDTDWITNNPYVHNVSLSNVKALFTQNTLAGIGAKSNYYRPVLFLTFMANYVIAQGISPLGYHLVNNSFHILNALLVFFLLERLFKRMRLAFIAALLFAIHPLQTEAVTYISGRGDPLSVFFILSSLWLFLNYRQARKLLILLGSLVLFVLAILSREVATVFPLFIIATVIALEQTGFLSSLWKGIKASIPYMLVAGVYGILRLTVFNFSNTLNFYIRDNVYTQHLSYRIYTFLHVILVYLKLIFIPTHLHMERSVPLATSLAQWPVIGGVSVIVSILIILTLLYRHERRQQVGLSSFRIWFFGWSFFVIWLTPSSGIIPVNALLYEHWLYVSLIGFFTVVAFYLDTLIDWLNHRDDAVFKTLIFGGCGLVIIALGWISIQRNILWGNPVAFYRDILRYEPDSVRIHNNLGNTYFDMGDHDRAAEQYQEAIKSEDIFPEPHFNLGAILAERNDDAGAIAQFEQAIKLDPNFHYPYQSLAVIYAKEGNFTKAEYYAQKLIVLRGQDPRVYYNLALVQIAEKKLKDALATLQTGLPYADRDPQARTAIEDLIKQLTSKL